MNSYVIDFPAGKSIVGDISLDSKANLDNGQMLASLVIGNTVSPNFKVLESVSNDAEAYGIKLSFDLPFSLSNLDILPISYDTRFQGVKEFLDKPYAVAGYVVGIMVDETVEGHYDVAKDLDNFIKFKTAVPSGLTSKRVTVYLGIVNSTLTETYAPFGIKGGVLEGGVLSVKYYSATDLARAAQPDNCGGGRLSTQAGTIQRNRLSTAYRNIN